MKECDNSKIHISSNFILSISLLIMFDTLLLRPLLHRNTSLHFTVLHPNTLHYTSHKYTSLHFTTLHPTTLHHTSPNYTSLHSTTLHPTTLHHTYRHFTQLHFTTLHPTTLHHTSSNYTSLHLSTLHFLSFTLHYTLINRNIRNIKM